MIRKIIHIDRDKCNGCGACAKACHEGAIAMVNGKAELIKDDYCDGLGDCLPSCPTNAISFEKREAAAYDQAAVDVHLSSKKEIVFSCPGTKIQEIEPATSCCSSAPSEPSSNKNSELTMWPVQIKLAPINAPFFKDCNLLIAADCTAYAHGNFHKTFMKNKVTLIGCPKLDSIQYADKLTEIIRNNDIKSVTVVKMEVPCCGGMEYAVKTALQNSGKFIPWQIITLSMKGEVIE